jgi:hypothetical protein
MAAATSQQLSDITSAINAINSYIDQIQAAQEAAANQGNNTAVMTLNARFNDANALEQSLNSLYTITAADSLTSAIASIRQTTATLDNQKAQIDQAVKDVGVAADIVNLIASIADAVAAL